MRIILVGLVSLAATTLSFGQGSVNFQNSTVTADPLHLSSPPDRLVRYGASAQLKDITFTNGNGVFSNAATAGLVAQLYEGNSLAVEGTLTPVATAPVTFRASTSAQVGVWRGITGVPLTDSGGATNAPGIAGKLQVRVWDSTYAPTYEAAIALGHAYPGLLGKSALFDYTPPNTNSAPLPADFNMTNFLSFLVSFPCAEGPAAIATNTAPSARTNVVGTTATFSIAACGEATLGYVWRRSPGNAPVGVNSPTLTLSNVQLSDAGGYYCIVTNGSGSATSAVATLVVVCPTISLSSTPVTNATIYDSYTATFSASGGSGSYNISKTAGTLPTGLFLSSGGVLSGTLISTGAFSFTITATDNNPSHCTGSSNYSITISPPPSPDSTLPLLVVKYPNPKKTTDVATPTVQIYSVATDKDAGIKNVFASVNGGPYSAGTLFQAVPGITKPYLCTNTVTLATGTNTIDMFAVDNTGAASTNTTFKVFFQVPVTVILVKAGDLDGTEIIQLDPKTPAPTYVGRTYLLDAFPSPALNTLLSNVVYSGSESGNSILHTSNFKELTKGVKKIPFLVDTNTTVTANFITNKFINAAGVYYGLFMEATVAHESSGWFTVKTDSKLKFTAKLMQEGELVPFVGTFYLDGVGTPKAGKIISRKVTAPGDTLTVSLLLNLATGNTISGTISNDSHLWGSNPNMDGDKLVLASIPSAALQAFAAVTAGSATPTTQPAGDGYVFGQVNPLTGTLKAKGYAGDGTKITKTTITGVSQNGDWPFYAPLYYPPMSHHALGSMIGWLVISNGIVTGDLVWTKTPAAGGSPYSGGFTNMHSSGASTLLSSPLTPGAPPPFSTTTGTVTIKDGNLPMQIMNTFTYDVPAASGKYLVPGVLTNGIKLKLKPTGELSGTFDTVNKYKVYGIALQQLGVARGVFTTGGTQSGSVRLTP